MAEFLIYEIMEHNFANLTTVLSRCSAKIANNVIEEIRAAINDALQGEHRSSAALTKMSFNLKKVKAERAAERAERRAAKKAAQQAQTARQGASIEVTTSEEYTNSAALYNINHQAFDYMCDSEDNACHIFSNNHPNVDDFFSTLPENLCDELATPSQASVFLSRCDALSTVKWQGISSVVRKRTSNPYSTATSIYYLPVEPSLRPILDISTTFCPWHAPTAS